MAPENAVDMTPETPSAKLGFKTCTYIAAALLAATVLGFELGSSNWKTVANDWKAQARDWESQSNEWKAKAAKNAIYADRWEGEAKKALDLAGRCVTPSTQAN